MKIRELMSVLVIPRAEKGFIGVCGPNGEMVSGRMVYSNGDVYEGAFSNEQRNGMSCLRDLYIDNCAFQWFEINYLIMSCPAARRRIDAFHNDTIIIR